MDRLCFTMGVPWHALMLAQHHQSVSELVEWGGAAQSTHTVVFVSSCQRKRNTQRQASSRTIGHVFYTFAQTKHLIPPEI